QRLGQVFPGHCRRSDGFVELSHDWSMIGRALPRSRLLINPRFAVAPRQGRRYPDVIDTQSQVAPKTAGAIIPPGVMPAVFRVQTKCVGETPFLDVLQRGALGIAE